MHQRMRPQTSTPTARAAIHEPIHNDRTRSAPSVTPCGKVAVPHAPLRARQPTAGQGQRGEDEGRYRKPGSGAAASGARSCRADATCTFFVREPMIGAHGTAGPWESSDRVTHPGVGWGAPQPNRGPASASATARAFEVAAAGNSRTPRVARWSVRHWTSMSRPAPAVGREALDEAHERDLGRVPGTVEHRLAGEQTPRPPPRRARRPASPSSHASTLWAHPRLCSSVYASTTSRDPAALRAGSAHPRTTSSKAVRP